MQDPSSRYFGGRGIGGESDDAEDSSLEESHEYNNYNNAYNGYNMNNNTSRDQGTAEYLREDHLEDFDSQRPDYKSTAGEAATATMTASQRDRIETATGMSLFDHLDQSIDSRDMEDLVDNYTFDGSTITSNIDSKHYRHKYNENAQAAIIDWGSLPASQRRQAPQQQQQPPVKPSNSNDPTVDSGSYSNNSGSRKSKSSRTAALCCGMGKLTLALILLTVLVCSIAVILYLVLVVFDNTNGSSNSAASNISGNSNNGGFASPCCSGTFFNRDMLGKEICREQINGPDVCCVVCDKNMASVENELENEVNSNTDSNINTDTITSIATTTTSSPAPTYIRTQAPSATPTVVATTTTMEPTATPSLRATAAVATTTNSPTSSSTPMLVYADSGNVCCPDRKWGTYFICFFFLNFVFIAFWNIVVLYLCSCSMLLIRSHEETVCQST